jgi:hypothetical protein
MFDPTPVERLESAARRAADVFDVLVENQVLRDKVRQGEERERRMVEQSAQSDRLVDDLQEELAQARTELSLQVRVSDALREKIDVLCVRAQLVAIIFGGR